MSKVFIINNNEYFSLRTSLVHLAFSISFYLTTYFSQGVSRTLHVPSLFFHHFSLVSHSLFLMYYQHYLYCPSIPLLDTPSLTNTHGILSFPSFFIAISVYYWSFIHFDIYRKCDHVTRHGVTIHFPHLIILLLSFFFL